MAAPQLRLEVSLNLTGFRAEVQKLTNIAQSEFAPKINVKFNRRTLDTELNNLQAAIKRRVYRIEIGGNIDTLPNQIRDLKKELASLESFKIDLGIGAVKSLSKRDASKIKSDLRAEILGEQKKIYVPVSIKPSIARQDIRDFKNAVQSQLTGLSVKVKADLEAASISSGAKSRSDIEADVRRGFEAISEIGAQRMAGGTGVVTEPARREQLKQSLSQGGFDIAALKEIGKQLGVAGVGRFKNANSLINKIVTDASIEMVKKYLDPQAVMRNSDRSGLGKVLDTFARGVFNMLGIDPASIRAQQQASKPKPFTPAGLLPAFTLKGAREEMMRQLTGGISPSASGGGGRDGKLALTNASNMDVQSVKVREVFDPREFEFATLRLFRVIGDALESASNQAKNARIDQSVDALMQSIDDAAKVAQARVRNVSSLLSGKVDVRNLGRSNLLRGVSPVGLLPPVARFGEGRTASPYSAGPRQRIGETQEELFARREREARMRSAVRGLSVSSEKGLRLPGTTFMGDAFTSGGGLDRVTGTGRSPQRGGAIVPYAPSTKLPSGYFESVNKYSQALNLGRAATDNFRASQIPFLGGLKNIAGEFGEATKQVLLYGTAYKGLAFVTSLPGQILNAAKSQQQFNNAMQVATQASGSYAKELLFVDNVQRAFGLDLETTRSGFTRLYASMSPAGFDSGSIEKLFVGISSAMASLQLTPDKAERVIYAFGQMASKGQVMSEELKGQLGDVLPGALAIFASAAGKSIKEFNKEIEDGVYSGAKFRDLMSKVTEELITRFGSGAAAAGRSLQGLMNIVKGDFTRLLESFAPLANSAAEAILKPLGGALRQLSVATKLATGERGRVGGQVTKQEQVVQELGTIAAAERGGPNEAKALEQYKGAAQSLEALNIQLENLNELAKDPAIAQQAEDIKAFTDEIGKAATFVKNFATAVGSVLSPVLNFLGTNLTSVIATVATLVFTFQGARLGLLAFAGVMTVVKGVTAAIGFLALVQQVGSFTAALATSGTIGKTVAAIYTSLGIGARAGAAGIVLATGATISFKAAIIALMSATGLGLLIAVIGTVGAAFLAMGDNAKQAAEDAKQAAKDMAEAARTGNVPQVEAAIRQASASQELVKEGKSIVKRGQIGVPLETLDRRTLSENDKAILQGLGLSLPDGAIYRKDLLEQINKLEAINNGVLKGASARLALAKKQAARTGQAIPDLGLQGAKPVEDPNAEKAAQRGKALLDAIEQREEAIAKARRQREEDIAKARKDAIENAKKLEESLAKERIRIEREVAKTRRDIAAVQQNIGFVSASISASLTGGDTDLVRIEQEITEAARKRNEDRITLEQQLADQQTERTKSIEALKKTTADAINEANVRYAKAIGDAQREYAKASTKIIEEGTNRAGKRLEAAAKLAGALIEQSSALSAYTSGTGRSVRVAGPNSFAIGTGKPATAEEFRRTNEALDLLGITASIVGEAVINTTTAVAEAEKALGKLPSAATSSGSAIQQISVNTADLTRNVQAANRAITGVGNTLRTENNKLGGQQFFLEYQKQIEKAVQGLGQARQSAEDEVKKTRVVLAARRQGLTGDQAESLYNAELLRLEALAEAQKAYDTQLSKTPPEEQQALTDDFEQRTIQIEGAYQALVRFNDALYNMPTELKLSVAIVEAQDRLRDLLDPVEQIKGAASSIGDAFGTAFKGIITGSMTAREALAGMFQSIADHFADMVAQMIAEYLKIQIMEGMQNLFKMFAPAIGAAAGAIGGGLSSGFSAGTSSAIDTGAGGWTNSFATPLKLANGGIAPGGFTAFANGGVVTGPTLGLVGEGRYNEAVIPLPDGKSVPVQLSGGDGGNQINSNITVNVSNGQAQSNATGSNSSELGRKIEGAVKQVIVGELRPGGLLASR